ncbi:hypothetical protein ABIE53_000349 [Burkholderia sp. OAS925]|jgi:hypothetical protein|uniref:hypothetical protein n=1 Tax=Paraburkholderia TaxID=1822464 RepID=UPI00178A2190|nr:hypothetical protein [Paraburkholderia graminis]MDR6478931.1 hypothetical protein [Paraburkholderia graminis]
MFDFSTGTLTIDAFTSLFHGRPSPDDLPLTGATELAKYGGMGKLWHQGREGPGEDVWRDGWLLQEELAMVDFICVDGVAREANYSTTEDDVVKEKKMLSNLSRAEARQPCVSSTINADTFVGNWGTLTVRSHRVEQPRFQRGSTTV